MLCYNVYVILYHTMYMLYVIYYTLLIKMWFSVIYRDIRDDDIKYMYVHITYVKRNKTLI